MKCWSWLLGLLVCFSPGTGAWAQEAASEVQLPPGATLVSRLTGPIDFWRKGPAADRPSAPTPEAMQVGPGKVLIRETVWAQPIRTPDGNWMLYVPPKPILDFLENPTVETAKSYGAWKKDQAEKLGRAMLLLGQLKDRDSPPSTSDAGAKDEPSPAESVAGVTLLYFKKPTCPHCISQDAVLAEWLPKHPGVKIQVILPEERPELWKTYHVRGTPTLVLRSGDGTEALLVGLQQETHLDIALKGKRTGAESKEDHP